MLQVDRRRDPYPFTWELPVGALTAVLLLFALGVQAGRAAAYWQAGASWRWPRGRAIVTSIPSILAGNTAAGLDPVPALPVDGVTGTAWIVGIETVLLVALFAAAVLVLRRWGPGRMRGMATAAEAEATLGLSRLHKQRSIIRPDLYPPRPQRRNP